MIDRLDEQLDSYLGALTDVVRGDAERRTGEAGAPPSSGRGPEAPGPERLAAHDRRRPRRVAWAVAAALLVVAGVGVVVASLVDRPTDEVVMDMPLAGGQDPSGAGAPLLEPGWTAVPDVPLSGRTGAAVESIGERVYVFGGWPFACPPGADCTLPEVAPFADGAVLDVSSGRWGPMADAPVGLHSVQAVVAGDDIYALSQCDVSVSCPAGRALFRYRTVEDRWEQLPAPASPGALQLTTLGTDVVAYARSDEGGEVPDQLFDVGSGSWRELPDDPLPAAYDRVALEHGGRLLVFGSARGSATEKVAAAFDPVSATWTTLPGSGTQGYQVWRSGELLYLNPHFRNAEGGVFDPRTGRWAPLPEPPETPTWSGDMAGVIGDGDASYAVDRGWALRTVDGTWVEVPSRPGGEGVADATVGAVRSSLVVFGGQRWDASPGELLDELWIWTPEPP